MLQALVGLGGNVGDVPDIRDRFDAAMTQLAVQAKTRRVRRAALYRTTPVGPVQAQPLFVNSAALVETDETSPVAFLASLLAIEAGLGRDRQKDRPQGPRLIDLDLLLFGELVGDWSGPPHVLLPHPRLHQRAFALAPLCELLGVDSIIPGRGPAGALLEAALADPTQEVEQL
jgi:2-amino-4-hydroxy-6-hydroxymethyldihydropteridine diphosphokinase